MGRYYNGDIEGKFMFAVQGSDAGEKFGAVEIESNYVEYYVERDNYQEIIKELSEIKKRGGVDRVTAMFDKVDSYNDEIMKEHNVKREDLEDYADYRLGNQMKEFFDDHSEEDELHFTAEY